MAYSISSSVTKLSHQQLPNYNKSTTLLTKQHTNSSPNDLNYDQQYKEWCETLKIELKKKSKVNVEVRMEKIENIVNNIVSTELPLQTECNFCINDDDKMEIMSEIEDKINSWRGVEIEVCRNKEKKNFVEYQATARNWFNRNKAKIYGNHLFYDMIFNHTLKVLSSYHRIH